jgi:hypothetical protein
VVREASEQQQFLLANLPPSKRQIRLALGIVAVLLAIFGITLPFANTQLTRVDAFIPVLETTMLLLFH